MEVFLDALGVLCHTPGPNGLNGGGALGLSRLKCSWRSLPLPSFCLEICGAYKACREGRFFVSGGYSSRRILFFLNALYLYSCVVLRRGDHPDRKNTPLLDSNTNMLPVSALTDKTLKGLAVRQHLPEAWGQADTTRRLSQDGGTVLCGRVTYQCRGTMETVCSAAIKGERKDTVNRTCYHGAGLRMESQQGCGVSRQPCIPGGSGAEDPPLCGWSAQGTYAGLRRQLLNRLHWGVG
jgi:hypothetical protein